MSTNAKPIPVGGPIWTKPTKILLFFSVLGGILILWRFAVGLGTSTGMNDGYPWGIWIAYDVVTGTALACGGYAIALLLYILNKGKYHPLIRPAILTSALGYTMAAVSICIDVGRPWFIWRIPLGGFPDMGSYNWNSALLEVALCVMAYLIVLWIELSPAFFEKWMESGDTALANFSKKGAAFMEKALVWIIALGILLPTMHQSSLGSLMLLSGPRLHGLWNTAFLPLLFLISCITMGYAAVVIEASLSSRFFNRPRHTGMLTSLFGVAAITVWLFLAIRFIDLIVAGKLGLLFKFDLYAFMFWLETILMVFPAIIYMNKAKRSNPTHQFRAAMWLILAGGLYRFNTYLVAFQPGENFSYFPTVPEMFTTFGIVATEILIFVILVKKFPILAGIPATAQAQ
jgi:Ni/Fe-hydrogenase subunit HybB-like protein